MKILIPIDFSYGSRQALTFAAAIGKLYHNHQIFSHDLELLMFHAYHPPIGNQANFFIDPEMLRREENRARNKMTMFMATVSSEAHLLHRQILMMSTPREGLIHKVKEEQVDLVVMGIGGEGSVHTSFTDSTVRYAMEHLPCPLLVVPSTIQNFHPKHIGLATDLEAPKHRQSLWLLKQLTSLWEARLDILHVHPAPEQIDVTHATEALELSEAFQDLEYDYHFPIEENPVKGLEAYLREHPVDLLAMLHHSYSFPESLFHRSTSLGFLKKIRTSMLILQDK